MEMEQQNPKAVAKRLWKVVRIVFFMLKSAMSKTKLMLDLNLMLKKGNKAISGLHNLRRNRGGGSSDVIVSSVSLREYEFSCSNSPANPFAPLCKRKRYRGGYKDAAATVQRVFELLGESNNKDNESAEVAGESPLVVLSGVRVTDSPFPVKDDGGDDNVVDKAAEEFIKRFYKNLKLQKKMSAGLESPYYCGCDR